MTTSVKGAATPMEDASSTSITPGIYLEEKNSTIGTGSTAKVTEYRTFWVTLAIRETSVDMVLLNDDFRPTPIRETFAVETIKGSGWHYIAEGEKRYARLRPHLDKMLTPPAAAKPAAKQGGSGNWWDGGGGSVKPAAQKKTMSGGSKKGNWWDG